MKESVVLCIHHNRSPEINVNANSQWEINITSLVLPYRGFDPKWAMGQNLRIDLKSKFGPKLGVYHLNFFWNGHFFLLKMFLLEEYF